MADMVSNQQTTLSGDDVIARSIQFFSTEKWRVTSQSERTATFEGKMPIPWFHMLCTIVGFICCLVPGIILYIFLIKKAHRFHNLVVTATPATGGCDVSIRHPGYAKALVTKFMSALPA